MVSQIAPQAAAGTVLGKNMSMRACTTAATVFGRPKRERFETDQGRREPGDLGETSARSLGW